MNIFPRQQSPDLNTTESLWSVLEATARNKFSPPKSLKQLDDFLEEEWYRFPLDVIENMCKTIPRRAAAIMKAKGGPKEY